MCRGGRILRLRGLLRGGALRRITLTTATQHLQGAVLPDQHLGDIAGDPGIVLPVAGTQLALDVDLRAFTQVFARHFRELAEYDNTMPFGVFAQFPALFVTPCFRRGQRQVGHRAAVGHITHVRVLPQMPNQNDFIHASSCHDESP
ncbi:Uncharacterised protein [Klebsiella oxytoca]|nr:Uncharacterised protein [Klebsiella oxytoca]